MEISVMPTSHWVTIEKPLSIMKNVWKLQKKSVIGPEKEEPNGNLGNAYQSLGDYRKAIEYHEKRLKIAKEIGDRAGEGRA